jgi:chaperonin GroES
MKIKQVVGYRLLVRLDNPEAEGIVLPEGVKPEKGEGTVVKVGDGRLPMGAAVLEIPAKVGDRIMMTPYGMEPFTMDGDDHQYRLISGDEVFAVLEEPSRIIKTA